MPYLPMRACGYNWCPETVIPPERYCPDHKAQAEEDDREQRGKTASRGYGHKWQLARVAYLRKHPLCAECLRQGRVKPATVVDHIIAHKGDEQLFWDSKHNWQSLCTACHNTKTAKEDGGFGRSRRAEP